MADGPGEHGTVWLVTGAGRGLGRAIATAALEAGDSVVAGVRRPAALADLEEVHGDRLVVVRHDVRERTEAAAAVAVALDRFACLDVVVNNAGYGLVGAIEEVSATAAEDLMATDLLGALWTTQAALPVLRAQGSGHVVQISTVGGVGSMPTLGLYNAAKWALEGFSEALAGEVAGFGVRVTIAELGGFDTDWAGSSMHFAEPLPAYDELRSGLFGTAEVPWPTTGDGTEGAAPEGTSSDGADGGAPPTEAAAAILAHVRAADGPLRLLVGDDAPGQVAAALTLRRDDTARATPASPGRRNQPSG